MTDMGYASLMINAIVVALMAMYVYQNDRRMEDISAKTDPTGKIVSLQEDIFKVLLAMNRSCETGASRSQYAFYAYLSNDLPEPGGNRHLAYDTVKTNIGHAYNELTGTFTVPRTGIYSFTWSTRVQCSKEHTTELVVNTKVLGSTFIWCGWNTVTGHVVTYVSQGETVFVRTHSSPGKGAIMSNDFGRSAFSGFLIA
ncbi:complement C1q tumor necrosis factor-related protein 3-like [Mytilus edulis]|uniref:complement C1q tumor necrosis factor-related protein 3-like n=1 Tax=Mytilus edulis TaxID=6550 RepID=UPI0039EF38F1